jgi:hypothetical protein
MELKKEITDTHCYRIQPTPRFRASAREFCFDPHYCYDNCAGPKALADITYLKKRYSPTKEKDYANNDRWSYWSLNRISDKYSDKNLCQRGIEEDHHKWWESKLQKKKEDRRRPISHNAYCSGYAENKESNGFSNGCYLDQVNYSNHKSIANGEACCYCSGGIHERLLQLAAFLPNCETNSPEDVVILTIEYINRLRELVNGKSISNSCEKRDLNKQKTLSSFHGNCCTELPHQKSPYYIVYNNENFEQNENFDRFPGKENTKKVTYPTAIEQIVDEVNNNRVTISINRGSHEPYC